jgi:hypothetical protein
MASMIMLTPIASGLVSSVLSLGNWLAAKQKPHNQTRLLPRTSVQTWLLTISLSQS